MGYVYGRPVQRAKKNIKGYIIGLGASAAILVGAAVPSLAAGNPPGYDNNPGRAQAIEVGAQCGSGAGSGAFGAFGEQGAYGHDFGVNNPGTNGAPGADGQATGMNNSAVCGNRQSEF